MQQPVIIELDEVDSTNTYGRLHFDDYPDGTLIVARNQTAGRGRRGRSWIAPAGVNFTGSMLFKNLDDGFFAGCIAGLGVLGALRGIAPALQAFLKWPNDVYIKDRKLAGILCESAKIENGKVTGVVAGIGVNVNLSCGMLAQIDQPATSLAVECGHDFPLNFFAKKVAESLFRYYIIYLNSPQSVFAEWKNANLLRGERLTVIEPSGCERSGVFRDILSDGAMLFEADDAGAMEFRCGDVKIDRTAVNWKRLPEKLKSLETTKK